MRARAPHRHKSCAHPERESRGRSARAVRAEQPRRFRRMRSRARAAVGSWLLREQSTQLGEMSGIIPLRGAEHLARDAAFAIDDDRSRQSDHRELLFDLTCWVMEDREAKSEVFCKRADVAGWITEPVGCT